VKVLRLLLATDRPGEALAAAQALRRALGKDPDLATIARRMLAADASETRHEIELLAAYRRGRLDMRREFRRRS
jgi:hypothetical protein